MSGTGIYRDEALEQDRMTLLNYLHNEGYADAKVDIKHYEDPKSGKLIIEIDADKGQLYRFGAIRYEGNTLISTADLQKEPSQRKELLSPLTRCARLARRSKISTAKKDTSTLASNSKRPFKKTNRCSTSTIQSMKGSNIKSGWSISSETLRRRAT